MNKLTPTQSWVATLTLWWCTGLFFATLFRWAAYEDKMHPPPSQAIVDKVYWDNMDYRAQQAQLINSFADGILEATSAYAQQQATNSAPLTNSPPLNR